MYSGGNFLSDKNLLNFMEESDIIKLSELFSNGKFEEIINTYFKKIVKKEINIKTAQEFLSEDYNNNEYGFNKSNNDLNIVNKIENIKKDLIDDNTINKRLTFGGSLSDFDLIINNPHKNSNNNLNNEDNKVSFPFVKNLSSDFIDDSNFNYINNVKMIN